MYRIYSIRNLSYKLYSIILYDVRYVSTICFSRKNSRDKYSRNQQSKPTKVTYGKEMKMEYGSVLGRNGTIETNKKNAGYIVKAQPNVIKSEGCQYGP